MPSVIQAINILSKYQGQVINSPNVFAPIESLSSMSDFKGNGFPYSVLHPDNQKALCKQGYYGTNPPVELETRSCMALPQNCEVFNF